MSLLDAVKQIAEAVQEDPETTEKLLDLKKELAEQIVNKMEVETPDIFLSLGKDLIVDYLVDEGIMDKVHDAFVGKGIESLTSLSPRLKQIREDLKKIGTESDLEKLKAEVLGSSPLDQESEQSSQQTQTEQPQHPSDGEETTPQETSENLDESPTISTSSVPLDSEQVKLDSSFKKMEGEAGFDEIKNAYLNLKGEIKPNFMPFFYAMKGYQKMKSGLGNPNFLGIVDLSLSNTLSRFFVLDLSKGEVVSALQTGHGKNSGTEFAKSFSNEVGSNQTSLGFYRTSLEPQKARTKNRTGLLLNGIEKSNDNARKRGIFIHPAGVNQSEGCFTLPEGDIPVINRLKGDALLFAYYPDKKYLNNSELLNG